MEMNSVSPISVIHLGLLCKKIMKVGGKLSVSMILFV